MSTKEVNFNWLAFSYLFYLICVKILIIFCLTKFFVFKLVSIFVSFSFLSLIFSFALSCSYFESVLNAATSSSFKLSVTTWFIKIYTCLCFKVCSNILIPDRIFYRTQIRLFLYDVLILKFRLDTWCDSIVSDL